MSHRRNDDGFRNQNFGSQGHQQQAGGRPNWGEQGHSGQQGGQFGGRQDQHSQYSGASPGHQFGSQPHGGQGGQDYGNSYAPNFGGEQQANQSFNQGVQPFARAGQERQWGPQDSAFQGDYNERQFGSHYGAADDPYRSGAQPAGWSPSPQSHSRYGSRGFGATGYGSGDHVGLGAFELDSRQNQGGNFNQQEFDQFGREQLGQRGFAPSRHHQDPHYQQWREEQLRRFDEDYHQWHQERYQNFSNDFDDWRSRRQGAQGPSNASIRPSSGGGAAGSEVGGDLSAQDNTKGGRGQDNASAKGGK